VTNFANLMGGLKVNFLDRIGLDLSDLVYRNSRIKNDPVLMAKLIALCEQVGLVSVPPSKACKSIYELNQLGPIVFCTPELGRWSTVGGLGVMVDELSIGLH
jgi:hypothetical protein